MLGAVWGDHWFIDNAGGFVRSKLGELLLTAVAVTAVAGPYCVIFKITEQYDLRMMFVIGYGSVVLFFPVYFVLDFFATFPCRYSTYFIFYSLAVQMFVLLVQIVRKPESIGYYLSCLGMYLLAIVPVVYMVLDIFMVWLKGLGWVGNIQQIMEEGFW